MRSYGDVGIERDSALRLISFFPSRSLIVVIHFCEGGREGGQDGGCGGGRGGEGSGVAAPTAAAVGVTTVSCSLSSTTTSSTSSSLPLFLFHSLPPSPFSGPCSQSYPRIFFRPPYPQNPLPPRPSTSRPPFPRSLPPAANLNSSPPSAASFLCRK